MSENKQSFIGYEYRDVTVKKEVAAIVMDGYENFGWDVDSSSTPTQPIHSTTIKFKRDRVIRNKAELTRLQRQFDAVLEEIQRLEKAKSTTAATVAYLVGVVGTGFLAGSIFALDADQMVIMILCAIPGLVGWVLPYFLYSKLRAKKVAEISPLIEQKFDELYDITKSGNALLKK